MIGRGESLCFSAMPAMRRAIWSAPPPVPAGVTNSMGLVGSHAAWAPPTKARVNAAAINHMAVADVRFISTPLPFEACGPTNVEKAGRPLGARPLTAAVRCPGPASALRLVDGGLGGVEPLERHH